MIFFIFYFILRVGGYPQIKIHQPAPAPQKIVLTRTRTHDLIFSKRSTRTRPAAGQMGRAPRALI